ncbi:MAG TPA: serine protease [Campylobacterales bacterium]|nr:serine protease [Campylobacterales bacterium]
MENSIVNIESVVNNSFGTGFVIDSDNKGVYILTCQHVLDDVQKPVVENVLAKVIARGNFIDMAVLYVSKLYLEPIPLQIDICDSLKVDVIGFSHFNKSLNQKKHIKATLYRESIELHATDDDLFYTARKIKADESFNFDRGNSGSPVICKDSGKVIAMISNKEGDSIGYAIDIVNLKDVWQDMPNYLLQKENRIIEQVSGIREDIEPKKKSLFFKYFLLSISIVGIFFGIYIVIDKVFPLNIVTELVNTPTPILKPLSKFQQAIKLENEAIKALIDRDYQKALETFKEANNIYPQFDVAYDIYDILRKNIKTVKTKKDKVRVLRKIIDKIKSSKHIDKHLLQKLKYQLLIIEKEKN